MVVNGYSNNTRLKTFDPNWATLGYKPKDNAEDHREALRAKGIDVDAPDRGEWEWPEHGGSFPRTPDQAGSLSTPSSGEDPREGESVGTITEAVMHEMDDQRPPSPTLRPDDEG